MISSTTREADRPAPEPVPFEALLIRVAQGDRSAFTAIYDRLAPTVLQITRLRCSTHAEAVSLVQEVFLQIWRRAPVFSSETLPAIPWIIRVADRTVAAHHSPPG